MTTCKNCWENKNCKTCPERELLLSQLDFENSRIKKQLNELPYWVVGTAIFIVCFLLIIATWKWL